MPSRSVELRSGATWTASHIAARRRSRTTGSALAVRCAAATVREAVEALESVPFDALRRRQVAPGACRDDPPPVHRRAPRQGKAVRRAEVGLAHGRRRGARPAPRPPSLLERGQRRRATRGAPNLGGLRSVEQVDGHVGGQPTIEAAHVRLDPQRAEVARVDAEGRERGHRDLVDDARSGGLAVEEDVDPHLQS